MIKKYYLKLTTYLAQKSWLRLALFITTCSLPILVLCAPYVVRGDNVLLFDWDYFAQMYEAFRIAVLKYHQFPWFNPWVAGGVPLYANPQFGLVSIQSILVLLFGTLYGLRLAIFAYLLVGFWGVYCLLRHFDSSIKRSILLGYVFIMGGFGIYHLTGGHLTFAVYYLIPWVLFSFVRMLSSGKWLTFALLVSFCIQSSTHYSMMQFLVLLGILWVLALLYKPFKLSRRRLAIDTLKSGLLVLLISAPKLYFSMQYLKDYPRVGNDHFWVNIKTIFLSFIIPPSTDFHKMPAGLHYSWGEYSAYAGIFVIITLVTVSFIIYKNKKLLTPVLIGIISVAFISFLFALGDFGIFSPFHWLLKLPVFRSMIAPARWLGWVFMSIILFIGIIRLNKRQDMIISALLSLAVLEIGFFTFLYIGYMNPNIKYSDTTPISNYFEQYDDFQATGSMRYLQTTRANLGEIRGYEAILSYDLYRPTNRCGINNGCEFILTGNARVEYWSPNKILLTRTGYGPIKININPGSYWVVNGKRIFENMKVVDLNKDFVIDDSSDRLELVVSPDL